MGWNDSLFLCKSWKLTDVGVPAPYVHSMVFGPAGNRMYIRWGWGDRVTVDGELAWSRPVDAIRWKNEDDPNDLADQG